MKFEEFKLLPGYPLQIQISSSTGQPERWPCRFVGTVAKRCLLISVPRAQGRLLRLRPGQEGLVRMVVANGAGGFATRDEVQTGEPYPLVYLEYPHQISLKDVRGETRVTVDQL